MKKRFISVIAGLTVATVTWTASLPAAADMLEGSIFQPNGENLLIQPPAGWRLAYMNGDPNGDYVVEFMPRNESHDSWREGYMSVQRGALDNTTGMASLFVQRVLQGVQLKCAGRFTPMKRKDSTSNGAVTSISGGFCDRYGPAAPYGEGSVVAVVEGKANLFVVQFGWRPATENELKDYGWRITPQKLQTYLDLLNRATLCGGKDQPACPR